jgi:hypothetical protein
LPARVAVASGNARALLLWPLQPLRDGHYRVVMRVAPAVTDIAGDAPQSMPRNFEPPGDSPDSVITTFDVEAAP